MADGSDLEPLFNSMASGIDWVKRATSSNAFDCQLTCSPCRMDINVPCQSLEDFEELCFE